MAHVFMFFIVSATKENALFLVKLESLHLPCSSLETDAQQLCVFYRSTIFTPRSSSDARQFVRSLATGVEKWPLGYGIYLRILIASSRSVPTYVPQRFCLLPWVRKVFVNYYKTRLVYMLYIEESTPYVLQLCLPCCCSPRIPSRNKLRYY